MKRAIALLMILVLLIVPIPSKAANEVFVSINNSILPLTDAMPMYTGGVWYVDYQVFARGDLGVNVSYNAEAGTAVLYTWDKTLVFNVSRGTAYNKEDKITHNQWSYIKSGTVYVPAQFTANQLGLSYSYISQVSTLRLKTNSGITDSMFIYIAKSRIPDLIDAYYGSKPSIKPPSNNHGSNNGNGGTTPITPSDPSAPNPSNPTKEEEKDQIKKYAYLTFHIKTGAYNDDLLDLLGQYGMRATFFLNSTYLKEKDDSIRRMVAKGHAVGVFGETVTELEQTNELLYGIAHVKSRLARIQGEHDAVSAAGYRQWGWNLDPKAASAWRVANNTMNALKRRTSAVIRLDDSPQTVSALPRILGYLRDEGFQVRVISVLDTPVAMP